MGKSALLVIDMQNDFMRKGSLLEVKRIRKNVKTYKTFVDALRKRGVLVVYTQHCYSPKNNPIERKLFPELRKSVLRGGTKGWEICSELKPQNGDIIINKTRYDAFFKTRLDTLLQRKKIKKLIITGTMTEICCESTARSAMYLDYDVLFCSDLTYTTDKNLHKYTLQVINSHFGNVMSSKEILSLV